MSLEERVKILENERDQFASSHKTYTELIQKQISEIKLNQTDGTPNQNFIAIRILKDGMNTVGIKIEKRFQKIEGLLEDMVKTKLENAQRHLRELVDDTSTEKRFIIAVEKQIEDAKRQLKKLDAKDGDSKESVMNKARLERFKLGMSEEEYNKYINYTNLTYDWQKKYKEILDAKAKDASSASHTEKPSEPKKDCSFCNFFNQRICPDGCTGDTMIAYEPKEPTEGFTPKEVQDYKTFLEESDKNDDFYEVKNQYPEWIISNDIDDFFRNYPSDGVRVKYERLLDNFWNQKKIKIAQFDDKGDLIDKEECRCAQCGKVYLQKYSFFSTLCQNCHIKCRSEDYKLVERSRILKLDSQIMSIILDTNLENEQIFEGVQQVLKDFLKEVGLIE